MIKVVTSYFKLKASKVMSLDHKPEVTPLEVVLTFFIHVLATFGSVALGHYFFPGSTIGMFVVILLGCLLINWHKNPTPKHSVIGWIIIASSRGKQVVQARSNRVPKLIDTLPPENKKD